MSIAGSVAALGTVAIEKKRGPTIPIIERANLVPLHLIIVVIIDQREGEEDQRFTEQMKQMGVSDKEALGLLLGVLSA